METWVIVTLAAALFQTGRFALQKRLATGGLSAVGATWARFLWSAPMVAAALAGWMAATGAALPQLTGRFWLFALGGGLAQILATVLVVALFSYRHFAVGITFKKSEVLLTALAGWLILGEGLGWAALGALLLGFAALAILSAPARGASVFNRAAALGLMSGVFFALAGVGYRGAILALGDGPVAFRAATALALVTAAQAAATGLWLAWARPGEVRAVLAAWRPGLAVGALSLAGSFCWFVAFALQTAALVFALGQVEILLSMLGGALMFGERLSGREKAGILALFASLVWLVLAV